MTEVIDDLDCCLASLPPSDFRTSCPLSPSGERVRVRGRERAQHKDPHPKPLRQAGDGGVCESRHTSTRRSSSGIRASRSGQAERHGGLSQTPSASPKPIRKKSRVIATLVVAAIAALVLLAGVILKLKTPRGYAAIVGRPGGRRGGDRRGQGHHHHPRRLGADGDSARGGRTTAAGGGSVRHASRPNSTSRRGPITWACPSSGRTRWAWSSC